MLNMRIFLINVQGVFETPICGSDFRPLACNKPLSQYEYHVNYSASPSIAKLEIFPCDEVEDCKMPGFSADVQRIDVIRCWLRV